VNVPGISHCHPSDDTLPAVLVMASGPDYMSACIAAGTDLEQAEDAITELAAGDRWGRSQDPEFSPGHPHPSPCERFGSRRHWLFERGAALTATDPQEESPSTT
jgi:hypothetical protein